MPQVACYLLIGIAVAIPSLLLWRPSLLALDPALRDCTFVCRPNFVRHTRRDIEVTPKFVSPSDPTAQTARGSVLSKDNNQLYCFDHGAGSCPGHRRDRHYNGLARGALDDKGRTTR
jgi:hypothetical protein